MRDALQAGMHADSKFKSRQKMNAAKNIQGLLMIVWLFSGVCFT